MKRALKIIAKLVFFIFVAAPLLAFFITLLQAFFLSPFIDNFDAIKTWDRAWNYSIGVFVGLFFAKQV